MWTNRRYEDAFDSRGAEIVVHGHAHAADDIESSVRRDVDGVTVGRIRALQTVFGHDLVVLAEPQNGLPPARLPWLVRRIRAAIAEAHGIAADVVALVTPGELADRTRRAALTSYRRGELDLLHRHSLHTPPAPGDATGRTPGAGTAVSATTETGMTAPAGQAPAESTAGAAYGSAEAGAAVHVDEATGGDPPSLDEIRRHVAEQLAVPESDLADEEDLVGRGLDSIRMMRIAGEWRRRGVEIKFTDLFERPTLAAWSVLLAGHRTGGSEGGKEPAGAPDDAVAAVRGGPAAPSPPDVPGVDPHAPFGLTPVQHAYWIGRQDGQVLGGVGCHFYAEFDDDGIDTERLERAVRALLDRHDLLRAWFREDGTQQILDRSPWPGLRVHDLREESAPAVRRRLADLRESLSHRRLHVERGEVFDVQVSLLPGGAHRLHLNFDLLVADVSSIQIMLSDLATCYAGDERSLPPLALSFPAYLAERDRRRAAAREQDREYWQGRLGELPGAPALPLAADPERIDRPRVVRRDHWMPPEEWKNLRALAQEHGLTLPMVLISAFAEVLAAWSGRSRFLLDLPLFDREHLHPDVPHLVADFTNLILLEADLSAPASFAERARRLQDRFRADVAHSAYSGVEVLRDLTRARQGERVTAPVVFTSAIGMGDLVSDDVQECLGDLGWMLSQTPQVWLDHQVVEQHGGLLFNWDAVEELFPAGLLDAMFGAFTGLLAWLGRGAWDEEIPALAPAGQLVVRAAVNDTGGPVVEGLLHSGFFARVVEAPERVALVWGESGCVSYGEVASRALAVAGFLRGRGVGPGDAVAVSVPRGVDQVVAVLGVLAAGGVYVPVGVDQPAVRRERIYGRAGVKVVLCGEEGLPTVSGVDVVPVSVALGAGERLAGPVEVDPGQAAYVIFTSGSTGEPKGVEVSHRAAVNTVVEVCSRFGVGSADRVLGVSALDFDLSVWDVFGLLGVGGAVVLVEEEARREPGRWLELMACHGVTVWNSVPALLDMLLVTAGPRAPLDLRLVLLSGDWVGLDLPGRLRQVCPEARLVALGGATEAAIWSNAFEVDQVDPAWRSVPYGFPLAGQRYRVVDERGRDCPDWVPGELWIGGAGVALGYRGDPVTTEARFVTVAGERWYRTGDVGRYWPDGMLEFLGRVDHQVKVRGHRIELGEIETALRACPGVRQAVATTIGRPTARLAAAVTAPEASGDPAAWSAWLAERLPSYMVPERITTLPALPLSANGKIDRSAVRALLTEDAGLAAEPVAPPEGPVETAVARVWAEVLDVPAVGRGQSFFALGGDSLLATRLVTRLRASGVAGAELSALFENPVLEDFAAGLRLGDTAAPDQVLVSDPDHRHEPFPPTDVQRAYWVGRTDDFALGGVGCHFYTEYESTGLDVGRLETALNRLIARHEMLRAEFLPDGRQRILPEVPYLSIPVTDAVEDETDAALTRLREEMSHQVIDATRWPLFDLRAVRYGDGRVRLGVSLDNIILDALSAMIMMRELTALYHDPDVELPSAGVSFRDYVLGVRPEPEALAAAEEYWRRRLDDLPGAPQLPLAADPQQVMRPAFTRREGRLAPERWQAVKELAREHGLTGSTVLATAFAEVLAAWSARPELTINLTLFDRREVHPDIGNILGDFTSLLLVGYRPEPGDGWLDRARSLQRQVSRDLEHSEVSAIWVMRELARRSGSADVAMPVVFTSTLGVTDGEDAGTGDPLLEPVWGVSQTPQVWLDHQVIERDGALFFNWDAVDELFPAGMVDAMFGAYSRLLGRLADGAWDRPVPALAPAGQLVVRAAVNDTGAPVAGGLLHSGFFARVVEAPERVALVWGESGCVSYGELASRALAVAGFLRGRGVVAGDAVAVSVPRGVDQVVAVLGVLAAGAVYVPVGVDQPAVRRERIYRRAGVRLVMCGDEGLPDVSGVDVVPVSAAVAGGEPLARPLDIPDDQAAYVIFTSGSTGEPKGVEVAHRAAVNTVVEVCSRFGVGSADRVLGVSALDFDLSVWDVFGLLGVGGAVVLVEEEARREPGRWLELMARHGVTVWNSVPALLDMLLTTAGPDVRLDLRLALVSGDWVGLDLPGRLRRVCPDARLVALGGATEAAIWSNAFEVDQVDPGWASVPYGFPLAGQRYRVVDERGRDCPDWVPGELWIGGAGVALGYRGDPVTTEARFVTVAGERWYRTGDVGRYWPDGTLEFLGRVDHQVKVRGHRIELGEIETALRACPGVRQAVATTIGHPTDHLAAFVVTDEPDLTRETLQEFLADRLPAYAIPSGFTTLDRLPVTANGKVDRAVLTRMAEQDTPAVPDEPPRGAREEAMARVWCALLGLDRVGRTQNFVSLGGDSILAARLAEAVRAECGVELTIREIFAGPTLAEHAALVDRRLAQYGTVEEGVV